MSSLPLPKNPLGIGIELGIAGGLYVLDKAVDYFSNRPTSSTPNLPVPVPSSQIGSTSPTIPVTYSTSRVVDTRGSRSGVVAEVAGLFRGNSVQTTNNVTTNYNNNIENIVNNYNTVNNNITNTTNNTQQSTNLLDTLKSNGEMSALVAIGLNELTLATASGVATVGVVGDMIYSKLDELVVAVATVASAIYENGANTASSDGGSSCDVESSNSGLAVVAEAMIQLKDAINPQSRLDYYDKFNQVNDFKLTPQTFSDLHGNDEFNISPLELRAKKDISVGVSHALENSTTLDEVDTSDIFNDSEDNLLSEAMKLFNFNGIADNLEDLMSNLNNGNTNYRPDVELKG